MDFFSILCTTCKTRLKVRDESAVGKILACPKCGGMVMVKPPAQWEATADEQGSTRTAIPNSASGTQPMLMLSGASAFDDVEDLLAGRTPAPPAAAAMPAPTAPTPPTPVPAIATPVAASPSLPTPKPETRPAPSPAAKAPMPAQPVTAPVAARVAPTAQPVPASTEVAAADNVPAELDDEPPLRADWEANQPWRYWFSLSCAGLAGTLLALVVVMVTIRWFQQRPAIAETPATSPITNVSEKQIETAEVSSSDPATDKPATTDSSAQSSDTPSTSEAANAASSTERSSEAPSKTIASKPATPETDDPLGLIPKKENAATPDSLDALNKMSKLLGEPKPEEEPKAEEKPLPLPVDSDPSPVPAPVALPRPEPRSIDVAARLNDKLPEIKSDGVPLSAFLQCIQELSTVPLTLEPESLIWVRATPGTPVSVHLTNSTVGDVLKTALAPLKLEPLVLEKQVVITLPSRLVTIPYPVGDLTAGDSGQLGNLVELVRELIEPESWKAEGGASLLEKKDVLEVKQLPSVQLQVLTLMEKLRVARGLAPRSKFDPAMFRIASRYERARSKLEKTISLNFSQPTSLIRILQQLGETGAMEILIDWRSLASEGWTPDSVATLVVNKQTLEESATKLLKPMDLAFRVVDEQTLQVVAAQDLAESVELELYPLADWIANESAETILSQIQSAIGEDALRSGDGEGHLVYDAPSKHLVALLSQPQQRTVAALLEERRMKTK